MTDLEEAHERAYEDAQAGGVASFLPRATAQMALEAMKDSVTREETGDVAGATLKAIQAQGWALYSIANSLDDGRLHDMLQDVFK